MQINNIRFKNLSDSEKDEFERYLTTKLPKIEEYAQRLKGDENKFFVEVEKFPTKSAYKVKFEFESPGTYIVAEEDDHTIMEVIDLSLDKLIKRLKKEAKAYKKKLDKELRRREK